MATQGSRLIKAKTWLAPNWRLSVYQFMHLATYHAAQNQVADVISTEQIKLRNKYHNMTELANVQRRPSPSKISPSGFSQTFRAHVGNEFPQIPVSHPRN